MIVPTGMMAAPAMAPTGGTAQAALPPCWQSVADIKAILDDRAIVDARRRNAIVRIETLLPDHGRVSADACDVNVTLNTIARTNPGQRQFRVIVTGHARDGQAGAGK